MRRVALAVLGIAALASIARASDVELTGAEGHPRERFPLRVAVQRFREASLDAAVQRALGDWNVLFRETLGPEAFVVVTDGGAADVLVRTAERSASGLMGETALAHDAGGVITLPVRVTLYEPVARGATSRETLLYQVTAHELGHALGLPHVTDPGSLMCCVHGSVDFGNPATREAYVQARQHPSVGSVRGQLVEQYTRFWRGR